MTTILHRRAEVADLEFVLHSWIDSYRMSHYAGPVPMPKYKAIYTEILEWLLAREGIQVWVAFAAGEEPPHDIFGWICTEHDVLVPSRKRVEGRWRDVFDRPAQPVVHYCYVKQPYRRARSQGLLPEGIATGLFRVAGVNPETPFFHTFKTGSAAACKTAIPGARFDPRLARFPKHNPEGAGEDHEP